jgi:hypothetical protein
MNLLREEVISVARTKKDGSKGKKPGPKKKGPAKGKRNGKIFG